MIFPVKPIISRNIIGVVFLRDTQTDINFTHQVDISLIIWAQHSTL